MAVRQAMQYSRGRPLRRFENRIDYNILKDKAGASLLRLRIHVTVDKAIQSDLNENLPNSTAHFTAAS
jgi:hypothetical protein